MVLFAMVCRS